MTTVYTIFICHVGLNIPCTWANDDVSHFTGRPFATVAECQQEIDRFNGGRDPSTLQQGSAWYVCMSKTVPTWEPTR
jgi:hypothetical protein